MFTHFLQHPIVQDTLAAHSTPTVSIVLIAIIAGLAVAFWRQALTILVIVIVTLLLYGAVTLVDAVQA